MRALEATRVGPRQGFVRRRDRSGSGGRRKQENWKKPVHGANPSGIL